MPTLAACMKAQTVAGGKKKPSSVATRTATTWGKTKEFCRSLACSDACLDTPEARCSCSGLMHQLYRPMSGRGAHNIGRADTG